MSAEVIKLDPQAGYAEAVDRAVAVLADGGLVAFPTETVYGVGASAAKASAVERLRQLKGRPDFRPFTIHLGRPGDYQRYVPDPPLRGRQLARNCWPGPLTIIFQVADPTQAEIVRQLDPAGPERLYHQGTIGLRCPNHELAGALLRQAPFPVAAASANPAGHPPPNSARQVLDTWDKQIDLLLDGGPARYSKPSTIVQVGEEDLQIVRAGVLDERTVRRLATFTILFVCSGNTCRSPMAEAMCERALAERLGCPIDRLGRLGVKVISAGTVGINGMPASHGSMEVMAAEDLVLSDHLSQGLSVELIQQADRIYTMCEHHRESVLSLAPSAAGRTWQLDEDSDVADPIGGTTEDYRQSAEHIRRALDARLQELEL